MIPSAQVSRGARRVLISKIGLDGHDRGARVVIRTLRDAGFDVIYSGLHRAPEEIVRAALDEDVDVLGVSILSGAHLPLIRRIADLLEQEDATDLAIVVGGLIPDEDIAPLTAMGVRAVFDQDTPLEHIVDTVREIATASRATRTA